MVIYSSTIHMGDFYQSDILHDIFTLSVTYKTDLKCKDLRL